METTNDWKNYIEVNRKLWNDKTPAHIESDFYDMKSFLSGKSSLNDIELNLLGDVKGKRILHLQCHFGQDSLSLARMGAEVTGIDLSDEAISTAKDLAKEMGLNTTFIRSDVYSTPEELNGQFDIVFTSYGTIGWLPDLNKWADVIYRCLKPGGKLIFVEFHPMVWMFSNDFSNIQYPYFNTEAIIETNEGTYADRNADIKNTEISWNHPLSEVLQALIASNLQLSSFDEFNYSPYNCFLNTVEIEKGKYQIKGLEGKIPMVYALEALKK